MSSVMRLLKSSWITMRESGSRVPFSRSCWTPTITEYSLGSRDLQASRWPAVRPYGVGETQAERRATQPGPYSQKPRYTRAPAPQARKQSPWDWPATLTDLCKQCAAVRTHCSWMREPPQMYTPRNRMLTCHGHLPTSTSCPFTTLQEMLVRPQLWNKGSEGKGREGAMLAPWGPSGGRCPHSRLRRQREPPATRTCGESLFPHSKAQRQQVLRAIKRDPNNGDQTIPPGLVISRHPRIHPSLPVCMAGGLGE